MNAPFIIQPLDLARHVARYDYNRDFFRKIENRIAEKIIAYDESYGHYLLSHLMRTSKYLGEFMEFKGYDADTVEKISAAFRLHDAGKIAQPLALWEHTDEKPTMDKKRQRAQHVSLGKVVLKETMDELGLYPAAHEFGHLTTITYLMEAHHERMNGAGPLGMTAEQMDDILKMATILDEIDGKMKLEHESLSDIFADINARHATRFDPVILAECQEYCKRYARFADISAIMTDPASSLHF